MSEFDIYTFYDSYPTKVILRPGYPARAQYKSTLMWLLFGKRLIKEAGQIKFYADVGGCFGFGANAMAYHISKSQGFPPKTSVVEIAADFVRIGQQLFPHIEFLQENITDSHEPSRVFDLLSMFDVIEHIDNVTAFLKNVSRQSRYFLLKTPMETAGKWYKNKPLAEGGKNHPDGHLNFFTPRSYLDMLEECGIEVLESKLVSTIVKPGLAEVLSPEEVNTPKNRQWTIKSKLGSFVRKIICQGWIPYKYFRFYWGGGDHLCLAKSKHFS